MASADLLRGVLYALAAGLMWGLVFVAPALLPEYPPAALAFGRYMAFGVVALLLAWPDRARLAALRRADWARPSSWPCRQHHLLPVPVGRHPGRRRAAGQRADRHPAGGDRGLRQLA
jgi:hypothetical protein